MDGLISSSENGTKYCVGAFQPITTAASSSYDVILGMSFRASSFSPSTGRDLRADCYDAVRNAYLLINYGDFLEDATTTSDPYVQLLSVTNGTGDDSAHSDFVTVRLDGVDTTGDETLSDTPLSSGNPVDGDDDDDSSVRSWLDEHRTYVIIAGSIAAGLFLLGLLAMIWRSCRGRSSRGTYGAVGTAGYAQGGPGWRSDVGPRGRSIRSNLGAFGGPPAYQQLHDPAPPGEDAYRMQGQNYGQNYGQGYEMEQRPYQSPWDQQHPHH